MSKTVTTQILIFTITCLVIPNFAYPQQSPPTTKSEEVPLEQTPEGASSSKIDFDKKLDEDTVVGKGNDVIWNDKLVRLRGKAYLKYQNIVLEADNVWADFDTNLLRATGNVHLRVENEDTFADELIYNLETKKGIVRSGAMYNEPWYYQGKEIFKVEEKESMINQASLTTCPLKYPHYYFQASKIIVHIDKELIAKHVILKVGGVPLLYLPVYRRDLRKDKRAKVIVKLGTDSYQGNYINVILPVARRLRYDGALLFEYTSRRGMGEGAEGKYNIRDVKFKEIKLKKPEDATPEEEKAVKARIDEILQRLNGDFNKYHLKQIFWEYKIDDADIQRAKVRAEEAYAKAVTEIPPNGGRGDFAQIAKDYSDDTNTKYQGGDLGFIMEGERKLEPELEKIAFQLQPDGISDIIQTEKGFNILKVEQFMDEYGVHEIKVRHILIAIKPSDETKNQVQTKAKEIHEQLKVGADFEAMVQAHSGDAESKTKGGDIGWVGLNEMESNQRYGVRDLEPGAISDTVQTDKGVYIFKLIDKEKTPTFEELAKQYSEGDEAANGGEKGYRGPWEEPMSVRREMERLDNGEVSNVIETDKTYRIIKIEDKRTYNGNLRFFTGDIYSYGREDSIKIGRRVELWHSHRHVFYTPWDNREMQRGGLTFMGRTTYAQRTYKEEYYGTEQKELRSFGTFTWGSAIDLKEKDEEEGRTVYPSSILSRLTIDKTFDFTENEGSGTIQKLPEFTFSWLGVQLRYLPLFKQINRRLNAISKKVKSEKVPLLGFPTLDNIRFSVDSTIGNYFKDRYRDERNIYLQTADIGFDVEKQSSIEFWPKRELKLDVGLDGDFIWHDEDQKGNRNITKLVFSTNSSVRNTLFRIYDIGFIPNASKLRHQIQTVLQFDYTPPVTEEENTLYPFGPSAYMYERRKLLFDFETDIQIKTRRNTKFTLLRFSTDFGRDFTYKEDGQTGVKTPAYGGYYGTKKYDYIRSDLTITPLPSRNLRITFNSTHDPNKDEYRKQIRMIGFRMNLDYSRGTYTKGWGFNLGNNYYKYYSTPSRNILAGFHYRPNRNFEIDMDVTFDRTTEGKWYPPVLGRLFDWGIRGEFYSQRVTLRRNLHDWDLRISWYRTGLSKGYVSKDFVFQINLIADPSVTMGLGYDPVTKTWGLQSLPVGMPYGAFSGTSNLGRSYF
jgi:parvulin-like peptidyl-prolyl isomerase